MLRNLLTLLAILLDLFVSTHDVSAGACLTTTCHPTLVSVKTPHSPAKDGDCTACHLKKEVTHPLTGKQSFVLIATGAKLCATCHDPIGKKKTIHPPAKEGECLSCHQPHGSDFPILLTVGTDRAKLCLDCHDAAPYTQKFPHSPIASGACNACHAPHESDEKSLLNGPLRELCLKCHADFDKGLKEATNIHGPVRVSPCTACHDPHSSQNAYLLKVTAPELCFQCHKTLQDKLLKTQNPHRPVVQQGGCSNCHATHYSKAKRLLSTGEMDLCLGCHGTDNLGTPPLRNIKKDLAGKKFVHGPIAAGKCTGCHDPHASGMFRLLTGPYPETIYAPYKEGAYDFCLKCHNKYLLKYPDTTVYTGFRNGNRNLHYVHVVNSRKGRTCRICHEPHAANGPKLTNTDGARFGAWQIPFRLELTESGGRCSSGCHKPLAYDRTTPVTYTSPISKKFGTASSARQGAPK